MTIGVVLHYLLIRILIQLDNIAYLDGGGDDHTVPSASQQDNNYGR